MFNSVFRCISLVVLLLLVGTIPSLIASEEVKWGKLLEAGMKEASKTGKLVMLDFYTDW